MEWAVGVEDRDGERHSGIHDFCGAQPNDGGSWLRVGMGLVGFEVVVEGVVGNGEAIDVRQE